MFNPRWWQSGSKDKRTSSPGRASPADLSRAEKLITAYRSSPNGKSESPAQTGDAMFSAERLRMLYNQVASEPAITDTNSAEIVAELRSISEILIWGDKNDPSVFEVFLEKRMLAYFVCILQQCGEVFSDPQIAQRSHNNSPVPSLTSSASKVRGILTSRNSANDQEGKNLTVLSVKSAHHVCTQVLQVLHILFENISQDTSLYFLLSNNYINQIIDCVYDFNDDEILAHYVSLMKILSAKLNPHTIHFFYMEDLSSTEKADFPLFDKALALFTHSESMVRIAARTVVLNVLRVKSLNDSELSFVKNPVFPERLMLLLCSIMKSQAEQFHSCLAHGPLDGLPDLLPHRDITNDNSDDISLLRQKMISAWHDHQKRSDRFRDFYGDHEGYLQYLNDLVELNVEPLKSCLKRSFIEGYLLPVVINTICDNTARLASAEPEAGPKEPCANLLTSLYLLNMSILNILDFDLIFPPTHTEDLLSSLLRCLRVFDNDEILPQDDRLPLLAVIFFTTLQQQRTGQDRVLPTKVEDFLKNRLLGVLVQLIHHIPHAGFVVCRAVVMRLACNLVDNMITNDPMCMLDDHNVAVLLDAKEQTCLHLQPFMKNDTQFVNMVELEVYIQNQQKPIQIDRFLEREFLAIFAFCPNPTRAVSSHHTSVTVNGNSGTPRNANEERGFPDLCKRWPLSSDEEGRFYLRLLFLLRRLCNKLQKSISQASLASVESEPTGKHSSSNSSLAVQSDLPVPPGSLQVGDVVDISSCDTIIGCQMIPFHTHLASKPGSRSPTSGNPIYRPPQQLLCPSDEEKWVKRFLIIHQWQMLFVEPDSRKVGFAVVKETFVLPNVQMLTEKEQRERIVCCCALALNTNHRNHDVNPVVGTDAKMMVRSIFLQVQQQLPQIIKAAPNDAPWNMEPHYEACTRIMFDDSIRALAASTRIKKNQERIRELKISAIAALLDMPLDTGQSSFSEEKMQDLSKSSSHHRPPGVSSTSKHAAKAGGPARRHPIMIHGTATATARSQSQEVTSSVASSKTASRGVARERNASKSSQRDMKSAPGMSIPMTRLEAVTRSGFIERVEPQ